MVRPVAEERRAKKNKKDSQLVIRLNRELRDRFVDLCEELDTSAARELRGFMKDFVRKHEAQDKANAFLNHGNYLAYGLAATTLWVLGIPHGFAVMHGKTRRGALVFDIADLIKDAVVLPWAFICAKENATEQEFRQQCLQAFTDHKALDEMFNQVKKLSLRNVLRLLSTLHFGTMSQCIKYLQ